MLMNMWFDLKYACRLWWKSPGYFLICTTVVALSVGLALWANVLVYTLAVKPLPFPGSDRWLSVQSASDSSAASSPDLDAYTYQEIVKHAHEIDFLGAFTSRNAVLSEGRASTRLRAGAISPKLMSAFQVAPLSGRLFDAGDGRPDAAPIAILSFTTWRNYFAGDPAIVGKRVRIDGQPVQVIGVMPENFFAFQDFEVWFPWQPAVLSAPAAAAEPVSALVSLDGSQQADALQAAMKPAVDEVNRNFPALFKSGRHVELVPAHLMLTHGFLPVATMISLIAVAVLLLGCVNVSLVLFARLLERSRELALRLALGSTRWRMLRQCLLESVLVMIPGLLLGTLLTMMGVRWTRWISDYMSQYLANGRDGDPLTVRPADLLIAALIAGVLWLLSTLIPAWRVARQDAAVALAGSGKGVAHAGSARSASLVVGFQVVISCLVLVVCMNLLTAISEESSKPTGIDSSRVMLSTYPTVFGSRYPTVAERAQYWTNLSSSVRDGIPGAQVAYATAAPTRPARVPVAIEGRAAAADHGTLKLPVVAVSENYFSLLGVSLRSGRVFDTSDTESALNTAVIDEVTAQRYWPGQSALGKRIQVAPNESGPWLTVVGVVSAVGHEPYNDDPGCVYRPLRQANPGDFLMLVKLPDSGPERRTALQEAAFAADQDMPLHNLQFLDDYLGALNITYTALVPAFGVIGGITLLLAASGLFGLVSRFVARRTQEIGVRRALGSSPGRIHRLFLMQGAVYFGVGLVGAALGLLVTNVLSDSISNILSHAALVTFSVVLLMAAVIFAATYLPTRRAVRLEPADALRYE